jgi:hypothetical protein
MYNRVKCWLRSTPSNAVVSIEITLDKNYSHDEAIEMAETVLHSLGISPSNIEAYSVEFFDTQW